MTWTAEKLAPLIEKAAIQNGLDPKMFFGQLKHESMNFRSDVLEGKRVSSAGAIGIAQFMPGTAKEMGVDPRNVPDAIRGAAEYMAKLKRMFGSEELARAAYNWGPGNLQQHLKNPSKKPMPAETANYAGHVAKAAGSAPAMAGTPPAASTKQKVDDLLNGPLEPTPASDFNGWRAQLHALGTGPAVDPGLGAALGDGNSPDLGLGDLAGHDAMMQDSMLAAAFSDTPKDVPASAAGLPRSIDSFLEKILTA